MSLILEARNEGVVTLTLNMPEKRNPLSDTKVVQALLAAVRKADADISVRAVILTGAGSAFCAGGDIKQIQAGEGLRAKLPAQTRRNYRSGIQQLPLLFHSIDVPVIAAVNGPAIGAGCDLACMCDIRIGSENAKFAESFVKLGIVPGDGGAWLFAKIIGVAKAVELTLTGEVIDALEALKIGLVSRVVPAGDLMNVAMEIAQKIAANPPHAVRMTKRLLRQAQESTLADHLEMAAALQSLAHATKDHEEALNAAIAKRTAKYTGE